MGPLRHIRQSKLDGGLISGFLPGSGPERKTGQSLIDRRWPSKFLQLHFCHGKDSLRREACEEGV